MFEDDRTERQPLLLKDAQVHTGLAENQRPVLRHRVKTHGRRHRLSVHSLPGFALRRPQITFRAVPADACRAYALHGRPHLAQTLIAGTCSWIGRGWCNGKLTRRVAGVFRWRITRCANSRTDTARAVFSWPAPFGSPSTRQASPSLREWRSLCVCLGRIRHS